VADYSVDPAEFADAAAICELHRIVAGSPGGLARAADEVSLDYVQRFVTRALATGVILVARHACDRRIVGVVHAGALGPRAFAHVLGELTIAVHPGHQGQGIGRALLAGLLRTVSRRHRHVQRVELVARESNRKAIAVYKDLGFREEGRLVGRILGAAGQLEADIPMAWLRPQSP
jgi:ribosomal protein S18 acetylase RimI-like enzyme